MNQNQKKAEGKMEQEIIFVQSILEDANKELQLIINDCNSVKLKDAKKAILKAWKLLEDKKEMNNLS